MPLGVLNNISAIYAENNLNQTQASLQNTLTQLSSGSRINSGADDPAGLSIANGLEANSAALTQSSSNASEGVGFLQVADGALAQVTSLLTSAVTLATEAAGGTLSNSQMSAADQEYQDILSQIGTIGSTTEYNGIQVFSGDQTTSALTWGSNAVGTGASATAAASQIASSGIVAGGVSSTTSASTLTQTQASPASFAWTSSESGAVLTSDAIVPGAALAGSLEFTPTVNSADGTPISVDLSTLTGSTLADQATSLATALNAAAGNSDSDYSVTVSDNQLVIGLGSDAATDTITALGDGTDSTTTQAAPNGFTLAATAGNTLSGTLNVTSSTSSGAGSPVAIVLDGVTTAGLVAAVNTALGNEEGGTNAGEYSVVYDSGVLTVGVSSQDDNPVTGISASGTITQATQSAGTLTVVDGDTISGKFTLTSQNTDVSGGTGAVSSNAVTVDLSAGVNTANLVNTVNTALGNETGGDNAGFYSVSYASGVLRVGVSAAGLAAGVGSVALANTSGNTAVSESKAAITNVNSANTLMGSFTLTPSTAAGAGTAVSISLAGVTPANLASTVQTALGTNYLVSYDTTQGDANLGNLNIAVSALGAKNGITSFTVAEQTGGGAASQETPISGGVNIYTGDGTSTGSKNYNVTVGVLSDAAVGSSAQSASMGSNVTATVGGVTGAGGVLSGAGQGTSLSGTKLTTQAGAEAALQTVDDAVNAVAYQRGQVGANINTLTAASNIASAQQTNITSAENTITATDYAATTSNMSKYEILTQTGISALAQANSTQQMVTKLLQ
jgi:flagellin